MIGKNDGTGEKNDGYSKKNYDTILKLSYYTKNNCTILNYS